ncbi:MAG: septum formation family protein [Nitriliruptoraceae bacterium]
MRARTNVILFAVLLAVVAGCGGSDSNVFELTAGTCFNDPPLDNQQVREVPIVNCSEPHDNETYALVAVPGDAYPGPEQVDAIAESECIIEFANYVGIDYADSQYLAQYFAPSEASWSAGDRIIVCYLFDSEADVQLQGSARDSGR